MNQNRKDQDVPDRGSVMDDQESFEHGSRGSDIARGMGSAEERGHASHDAAAEGEGAGKKKARSLEDLPAPGWKMEER